MSNIWGNVDFEGLIQDAKAAAEGGTFEEIPHGKYEVKVEKMETKLSKKGSPMLSIWFKIIEGPRKGGIIFYNQVLTTGFGFHNANEFLRSMETGVEISPKTGEEFDKMLLDVNEAVEHLEFVLNYGVNEKGFNIYKIEDVFEI